MSCIAIGIDLGTTNTCVGVIRNGRDVEIIANRPGSRLTPSCVAFSGDELRVGEAAKTQAAVNPLNTVYDIKRLMGRKFADIKVQKMMDLWPFQVKNVGGNPTVEVEFKNVRKMFTPEELSARILINIKGTADDFIGRAVTEAVITVPAYFKDSQRQATIDAGKIAGLKVLAIINEPTAAAIAYGFKQTDAARRNVLVFDLGGGTLDVALLTIQNGNIEVEAVGGDTFLGGGDFDNILMEHFMKKFNKKHKLDMSQNPRALGRLRTACEKVKCNLSYSVREEIIVECLFQGTDLEFNILRSKFENLCKQMFDKTLQPVETVLKDAGFDKSEVDEVILVGGSTRIPYIRSLLKEFFDGKKLNTTIDPVEAVAYGAAVHAAALVGATVQRIVTLQDVCSRSLGINVLGGYTSKVIRRNTKIPVKKTMKYNTTTDGQTAVDIKVYEGEHDFSAQNKILGEFALEGIFPAPKGTASVDVTFAVNRNGVTTVTAVDPTSGIVNFISVTANKGGLDDSSLHRMIEEAKSY